MMDNLGVAMNATTLQAYALEKGINFDWKTADNAEKAELAMQMFFEKTEGYAGNFVKESEETLSGSFGSVKAAWEDLMGNLVVGGDVTTSFDNLTTTVSNLKDNVFPAVQNVADGIKEIFQTKIPEAVDTFRGKLDELGLLESWDNLKGAVEDLYSKFQPFVDKVTEYVTSGDLADDVTGAFSGALGFLLDTLTDVVEKMDTFVGFLSGTENQGNAALRTVKLLGETVLLYWGLMKLETIALSGAFDLAAVAGKIFNAVLNANPIALVVSAIVVLVGELIHLYNTNEDFRNKVNAAWASIKSALSSVWDWMSSVFTEKIPNALNKVKTAFQELPGKALQWGKDLLQNFIDGISAKIQALVNKVKEVAGKVKDFLGFSEPDKGPLSNFHTYAPDMMKLYAEGIRQNADLVTRAVDEMARDTANSLPGMNVNAALETTTTVSGGSLLTAVQEIAERLDNLKIVLDSGLVVGGIVDQMDGALGTRSGSVKRGVLA